MYIIFTVFLILSLVTCTRKAPKDPTNITLSKTTSDPPVPVKIIEGDPLIIYVAEDASYQIDYRITDNTQSGQVYPPFAKNAD